MVVENESPKAKVLAKLYRKYFEEPFLNESQLKEAEEIRKKYILETNYKANED